MALKVTKMKYLRMQYGAELKDVSIHLGVSDGYVSKLENGWYARIPAQLRERIIDFYGEPYESLQEMVELPVIKALPKLDAALNAA